MTEPYGVAGCRCYFWDDEDTAIWGWDRSDLCPHHGEAAGHPSVPNTYLVIDGVAYTVAAHWPEYENGRYRRMGLDIEIKGQS